jgi:prepilin-type processing-associated H-X9-DG protein
MTTYNFTNGSTISGFVIGTDVLFFPSAPNMSAALVGFGQNGANLQIFWQGQSMTINGVTFDQLVSANFSFADGSILQIGRF